LPGGGYAHAIPLKNSCQNYFCKKLPRLRISFLPLIEAIISADVKKNVLVWTAWSATTVFFLAGIRFLKLN